MENKELNEVDRLLLELKLMKSEARKVVLNNAETWKNIGSKDLEAAGFESQADLEAWLEQNEYQNL